MWVVGAYVAPQILFFSVFEIFHLKKTTSSPHCLVGVKSIGSGGLMGYVGIDV